MSSLACIFTTVVATVCLLVPGVLSGLILIQNLAQQGVGFVGKPIPNGLITATTDITQAAPIMFDPTNAPFPIFGFGGAPWGGRHALAVVVNNADHAWNTNAHRGALVVSSLNPPALATPTSYSASAITSSHDPATHKLETSIFSYNSVNQEISAKWVTPAGVRRNALFTWNSVTGAIGVTAALQAGSGLVRVRLFLLGSYTISGIVFDPHFRGFNGDKYDVQGETDTWFNLITDSDIQFNGYFQTISGLHNNNNTYIRALGVVLEGHTVYMNTTVVELDGEVIHVMSEHTEAEHTLADREGNPLATVLTTFRSVTIQTRAYFIDIDLAPTAPINGVREFFFNVQDVELFDTTRQPHGLMGQTAHKRRHDDDDEESAKIAGKQGQGEIEGVYTDYKVSSAFGTDFKYNQFTL